MYRFYYTLSRCYMPPCHSPSPVRVLGTAVKQRPAIGDGSRPHGKVVIDMKGMISSAIKDASSDIHDHSEDRLLRPLAGYTGFNSEMRELAAVIAKVDS